MKAIVINDFGGPEVLEQAELERPAPAPGEVLIEVKASSVNPVDWKLRSGVLPPLVPSFPAILHPDCAGVVVEVGNDVWEFSKGDQVWSFATGLAGKPGALAEYMVADARMVALKPPTLSFEEAATLPLVGITAWLCLIERMEIPKGASLLIQGGTGGVGFIALQLARAKLDVRLFTTCGTDEKCALAESLGAERAFNYTTTSVDAMVAEATGGTGFDVVFNTPGSASIDASVHAARFGGTILDINSSFPVNAPFQIKQLGLLSVFAGYPITHGLDQQKVGTILAELSTLVTAGKIRPLVDPKTYTYAEIAEAHAHQQSGSPTGKIALTATF